MYVKILSIFRLLLCDVCPMSTGSPEQVQKSEFSRNGQVSTITKRASARDESDRRKMASHDNTTAVVRKLLHNYNPKVSPMNTKPTEVRIGVYVKSFYSISEQTMDFSLGMYLRQSWCDPRLTFEPIDGHLTSISLVDDGWEKLWTPDTYLSNEKRSTFHNVMKPNRLMKLNSTGHVWYVTKISTVLSCPMKLHKYPMDKQSCSIVFESFGYTMDTMYFTWLDSPVHFEPSIELPQHTITDTIQHDCSQNYTAGAFPCLEIKFLLQRDIGYYLMWVYLPSSLIVVLSWASFLINIEKVAKRVSVGLVIILTMTTWNTGIQSSLPHVSYIKSIDIWLSSCFTFVFASLVEVGIVHVMSQKTNKSSKLTSLSMSASPSIPESPSTDRKSTDVVIEMQRNEEEEKKERQERAKNVDSHRKSKAQRFDEICRVFFPLAFLLFTVGYWTL